METGNYFLVDPFGFRVNVIEASVCSDERLNDPGIYNDFQSVIERPAFVIVLSKRTPEERYYFRSVGWDHNLLIRAQLINRNWEANECIVDPSDNYVKQLANEGRIVGANLPEL